MRPHFIQYMQFTDKYLRDLFDVDFVINGKGKSLHKVIKHVKRSKSLSDDFIEIYTLCEPSKTYIMLQ